MALDVTIYQGNNKDLEVEVTDENDNIVDLSGGVLLFRISTWRNETIIEKSSTDSSQISLTDPTAGKAEIHLIPSDTINVTPGSYVCVLNLTTAAGNVYTMDTGDFKIMATSGSYLFVINKIRNLISDKSALNVLTMEEESTDERLIDYIQKSIDYFNGYGFQTTYSIDDYPNLGNLIDGTIIQILIGEGILSARNLLTYNDTGGVQVSDFDKYGRYINWYNVLINKYMQQTADIKRAINVENAYGTVQSEFSNIWNY